MNIVKKFWKYILGAVVVLGSSGALLAYVLASNDPVINLMTPDSYNFDSEETFSLQATVAIPEYAGTNADALVMTNLEWTTGNSQIIGLTDAGMTGTFGSSAIGQTVMAKAIKAGRTQVTATFYYKVDADGKVTDEVFVPENRSEFESISVSFQSSFTCNFVTEFDPADGYADDRVYNTGVQIRFNANTYTEDPIYVSNNNDVVSWGKNSFESGYIKVEKGGVSDVYIRPESGYDAASQTPIPGLYRRVTIRGAVRFTDDTYVLPATNYGPQTIGSNIDTSDNSGVSYTTTDASVAYMEKSVLMPVGAGYATITAGIKDSTGNFMVFMPGDPTNEVNSADSIDVTIPFVWMQNGAGVPTLTQNLNVGDFYQLKTNATDTSTVTFTSSKPSVAAVSNDGNITARSSGTTTITAKVVNGAFTETIEAVVNVVDTFSLSTTSVAIAVGESYNLEAIGSADGATVTFTVDGLAPENANGGLKAVVDEDNPNILKVTGVLEGTYTVVARMELNGMVKTATATISVKTPVSKITIEPQTLNLNVNETANLRVQVEPNTAYNKNVVWVSSDSSVVEIDTDSATEYEVTVKAKKGGIATVTVVSVADGTKYASCTINVREAVTGIELNESNVTVNMIQIPEYVLLATVYPVSTGIADGVNRNVIWSSTDESILTVDQNGKVTFVAPGSAAVVAKTEDGGFTAYCNFVVSVPVTEIKITSDDLILKVGDETTLSAEVLPLTASNRTVVWSSTDENVVTIDTNGTLKALKAGHAAIFCRSLDSGVEDYINVYVKQPVSSIELNTHQITVPKGTVFWLYATILPENADVKIVDWSSGDESLATVASDGMVTALMPGVVTITATSRDTGDSDYCIVTIEEPVTSIRLLTGDSQTLFVGAQFTIVPEVLPVDAPNKAVTYKSTNTDIATVDENGVVTAVMGGTCDIIVTTVERQLTAVCHITVKEYLATITLDKSFTYINVGSYVDIIATTTKDTASNKNIIWKSSNEAIAKVDQSGRVTGVAYGTAVITAVAEDGGGATASCVVQVIEPVTSIVINPSELNMLAGDKQLVTATIVPSTATVKALKWESSDSSVATVDQDGEITAVSGGKCRIYAYSTDGNNISAYCTVYVTNKALATKLTLNSSDIKIKIGEHRQLTVKSIPEKLTEELGWYSTDTGIVTVDQKGNIVGIAEGVANIVVYGKESGVETSCKVTVESDTVKATSIKLNSTEITMLAGKTRQLTVRMTPTNCTEALRWYSTDTSVVVVDANGKISTVGPGQAQVIAVTATTGLEASCTVHSIAISRSSVTLQQYDPFQLYVDGAPGKVSWRTNNPRIATVSSTGEVIGRKAGTTTITATVDGKTVTCTVTITEATKY